MGIISFSLQLFTDRFLFDILYGTSRKDSDFKAILLVRR